MRMPSEDEPVVLLHGDCLAWLPRLPDASVDSVVTDPPAGIGFMGKTWDSFGGRCNPNAERDRAAGKGRGPVNARNPNGKDTQPFGYSGSSMPSKAERSAFIDFLSAVMAECLRVLKPGGHALVWAIPRTSHWTATAIEDAGFEVRDRISHLFGSGFPKSHNLDGEWDGWGTALKPACEDWWLCRKPLAGTVASNVRRYGTGALNIAACRVPTDEVGQPREYSEREDRENWRITGATNGSGATSALGRWPANVTHDGSEEVVGSFPESEDGIAVRRNGGGGGFAGGLYCGGQLPAGPDVGYGGSGSVARFFYCAKADRADRDERLDGPLKPLLWSAGTENPGSFRSEGTVKAARNNHPTVKPFELMRWLCRLVTPPGGLILDPFCGSGSTGKAAVREGFRFVGIDREREYLEIAAGRIHHANGGDTLFARERPEIVGLEAEVA